MLWYGLSLTLILALTRPHLRPHPHPRKQVHEGMPTRSTVSESDVTVSSRYSVSLGRAKSKDTQTLYDIEFDQEEVRLTPLTRLPGFADVLQLTLPLVDIQPVFASPSHLILNGRTHVDWMEVRESDPEGMPGQSERDPRR